LAKRGIMTELWVVAALLVVIAVVLWLIYGDPKL
jgi:hypothetical protein